MSDQFIRFSRRQSIVGKVARMKSKVEELREDNNLLYEECETLREERDNLKRFAYEDAPRIAAEQANAQTAALKAENQRLREELGYIANAQRKNFEDGEEFRTWAQSRARHALNQEAGTPTIKKA